MTAPADGRRSSRAAARAIGRVIAVSAIFAILFVGGACGSEGSGDLPEAFGPAVEIDDDMMEWLRENADVPSAPGASTDLVELRTLLGPPDVFSISWETIGGEDGSGGEAVRYETWVYYDLLTAFEFGNGALLSHLPVDDVGSFAILPLQYNPSDFLSSLTWDDVSAMLANPEDAASTTLSEEEFGAFLQFYAGEQLLVGFDEGGLVYVETFLLELGGGD